MTKYQNTWKDGKKQEGHREIRPLLTPEADAALQRLQATRKQICKALSTTQSVVNEAIIHLDRQEKANAKLN